MVARYKKGPNIGGGDYLEVNEEFGVLLVGQDCGPGWAMTGGANGGWAHRATLSHCLSAVHHNTQGRPAVTRRPAQHLRCHQTQVSPQHRPNPQTECSPITYPEVVYSEVRDLVLDPVECGVVAGAVLLLHEVGEVGHAGQLVQVWGGEVAGLQHLRDAELLLRNLHGALAVLAALVGVELPPVGAESRPAVVQQRGQLDTIVPVACEVLDVAVGQHRLP